MNNSGLQQTNS